MEETRPISAFDGGLTDDAGQGLANVRTAAIHDADADAEA